MPLDSKQCPKCGSDAITKDDDEAAPLLLNFPNGERPPGDLGTMRAQHWTCTCGHDWTVVDAT